MTTRSHRKLTAALLGHVVLCLALAPVVAARQAAVQEPAPSGTPSHHNNGNGTAVQAAYDASNVRPEEDTNGERKKGKSRSDSGRRKAIFGHFEGNTHTCVGDECVGGASKNAGISAGLPKADSVPAGAGADEGLPPSDSRLHAKVYESVRLLGGVSSLAADEIRFRVSRLNAGNPAAQPVGPPSLI